MNARFGTRADAGFCCASTPTQQRLIGWRVSFFSFSTSINLRVRWKRSNTLAITRKLSSKQSENPLLILDEGLRIQAANRAFFDTFHLSQKQIINRSLYEVDESRWNLPAVTRLMESLLQDGRTVLEDVGLEREVAGQGQRTFQLNVRLLQRSREHDFILLALEDITDRKRTAEAKYRRLFETAQDGIVIIDAETGEINDLNPLLTELLGVTRTSLVGKPIWETQTLSQLMSGQDALKQLQREKVMRFPEISLKTSDGQKEFQVEVVANIYLEGANDVAQFNIRDITERKRFDQQLQQTAHLRKVSGITSRGQRIAHDFNNLLAGILGNAGLALGEAPPGSSYHSALKNVVYASQRAAELTRQMLAYAGKGRLNVRPLDLSDLVKEISKLLESSIPKSVELQLNLAPGLPPVKADSGQMQQVVMNLVINGAEAIGEGRHGHVRVNTRLEKFSVDDLREKYSAADLPAGAYVLLEVADDGSGMEEHVRERIFDPFFTTKFTGRGLGLSAVQGIVRGHRGAIHVASVPGKGSWFHMLLPAAEVSEAKPAPEPTLEELRGTGLVLVVDDEKIVLQTTRMILERFGYQVLTAENGEQGIDAVLSNKERITAVILDLTMPLMSGEETLVQIEKIAPSIPVILSSGYDSSQAISRFGENRLAGFPQKAVDGRRDASYLEGRDL